MTFQDAVKKSIKAFLTGKAPKALAELKQDEEGLKYTPEYFDELEDAFDIKKEVDEDADE